MVFSSLEFLCVFLPVVFLLYCVIPNLKVRNAILILASLLFYAYGEPVYVLLMLGSVIVNYTVARLMGDRGSASAGSGASKNSATAAVPNASDISDPSAGSRTSKNSAVSAVPDASGISDPSAGSRTSKNSAVSAVPNASDISDPSAGSRTSKNSAVSAVPDASGISDPSAGPAVSGKSAAAAGPDASESAGNGRAKAVLAIGIVLNLGTLAIFKYAAFFVETLNSLLSVFQVSIPVPDISLPIGISFFTFQAMSYIIDVYRGKVDVQKNFFHVLLYISFFPQLIAGPIVKYRDISTEIADRHQDVDGIMEGLWRFLFGLGKKVLIANTLGLVADNIFSADSASINIVVAWLGAVAYMLQIYYDFSGYSDMAIGLGKMFGFHFKENFLYPYGASNIQEFWRRWHISLSTWFREYLYFPLGGNRKGKARTVINRLIVFFCTGLWHGASWTFVLWGLWHGFFLLLEEVIPVLRKLPKAIGSVYTLLVVCIGFVFFRADTLSQGAYLVKQMFTGFDFSAACVSFTWQQLTPFFLCMLVVAVITAAPIRPLADRIRVAAYEKKALPARLFLCAASLLILCWCILRLSAGTYNPFIYFRF